MIKTVIELVDFLFSLTPFLVSLMVWTTLAIVFSKSIKKHAKIYYWVFGFFGFAFAIPIICRLLGFQLPFSINSVPIIGKICSELSSAAYFIHPVLVIIMAMGAFSTKVKYVAKLMSIRKELSIIVGFPLLAHLAKRLFGTFPKSWSYFANYEESIANPRVVSQLGSDITNAVMVLGIVMTVLFIILWVTSFDSMRRKMGQKRWKSVQRWSYALYAMLFIHSVGLQLGGAISYKAGEKLKQEKAAIELVERAAAKEQSDKGGDHSHGEGQNHSHGEQKAEVSKAAPAAPTQQGHGHGHGPKGFSFSDIEVTRLNKAVVNIIIYILIYGSYLFLRLRKAKANRLKRANR